MRRGGMGMRRGRAMRRGRTMRRRAVRRTQRRIRRRRIVGVALLGGLVAYGSYKLGKRDVQRVEQHTGRSANELNDEEMGHAMDELGIQKQYVDDDDLAYIDQQQPQESSQTSYLDELERLAKLREAGYITEQEFEDKKKQLLG